MYPLSPPRLELDAQRHAALLEIADVVSRHHQPGDLFRQLAPRLRSVVAFDFINFAIHDGARNVMQLYVWEGDDWPRLPLELPVEETVAGQVWKNQSVVYIEDLGSDTRNELGLRWLRTNELRSYCVLPLTTFHKGLGALGFGSRRDHSFDAHDLIFLRRAAELAALCLDSSLSQAALVAEKERLRLLLQLEGAHPQRPSLQQYISSVLGSIQRWAPHDYVGLYIYDESLQLLRLHMADSQFGEKMSPQGLVPPGQHFGRRNLPQA